MSNLSRLPRQVAEVWEWQRWGNCRSVDATVFFAPEQALRRIRSRRDREARAVCARCPVRPECAALALSTREQHGIWGGFTESERRRLLALGWEDLADRRRRRVDVAGLVARLRGPAATGSVQDEGCGARRQPSAGNRGVTAPSA